MVQNSKKAVGVEWKLLFLQVKVSCEKTGYYAEIDFLTKPFIG